MNELITAIVACSAWVALCALACVTVCAVIYNAKEEEVVK